MIPSPGAAVEELRDWLAAGDVTARDLATTPQDAKFHAEGDVWTHTQMVLTELVAQASWAKLDDAGRAITFAACLLHDVGKPATTRHEPDGRISSRGHSARGEHIVRKWLWRQDEPFGVREHVCALVRHHQVPFFGVTRAEAEAAYTATKLSLRLRHDWLAVVAEADARGRRVTDPQDQQRMLDHTALWAVLCEELGCLDRPRAFASDHARVVYGETEAARARPPEVHVHDDTTCEVIVMAGLPASGKDHWLVEHQPDLPAISLDALREAMDVDPDEAQGSVVHAAKDLARGYLRTGRGFVWNATNLGDRVRSGIIALARGYRARVRVVYVESPIEDQEARNRARDNPVPRAAIDRLLDRWTMPGPDEAHSVDHVVTQGPVPWPPR